MILVNVELMQIRLTPIFLGVVIAVATPAWGAPEKPPVNTSESESVKENSKKKRGFLSLFKRAKKKEEKAEQNDPKENSSEQRRKTYVTIKKDVPFYHWGPIQAGGPDRLLEEKLLVTILKEEGDWIEVRLEDGEKGVVPSDLIRKANASDFPVQVAKKKAVRKPSKSVVVFETVPAPPLPELENVDLDALGAEGVVPDLLENPLLFPAVLPEDLPN